MTLDYFYDEQLRRYMLQFVRIFNQFQWQSGKDAYGNAVLRVIPATLATMDRQVLSIIQNGSENVMLSTPQISCWITSLKKSPDRVQDPNYVRTQNVYERDVDPATGKYTSNLGLIYNVQSYMPVPYDLYMQTDIWTSSELQKHQILEQILILFNPAIDLQTGNNILDWTSLTNVELQEITWSSRTYPTGTNDAIDIASLTFKVPIWLTAPAKIRRKNLIEQIVIDIGQVEEMNRSNGEGYYFADSDLISRLIVTPGNFRISVSGNEITLLNPGNKILDKEGFPMNWITLLQRYAKFRNNISQIRLKKADSDITESMFDIVGILQLDPLDPFKLFWTTDLQTLPPNTIASVTSVINPTSVYPGKGLSTAVAGQRYLILHSIPTGVAWGGITANANDIIEYVSGQWSVVFQSNTHTAIEHGLNTTTGQQLRWNGSMWHLSIDGEYDPGYWRLAL